MNPHEKVANIIAFLAILFGEDHEFVEKIVKLSPDYIIEKFSRYVASHTVEYHWGMHPSLRRKVFHAYTEKWKLELSELVCGYTAQDIDFLIKLGEIK